MKLIHHIYTNLRCILVDRKTLEFGLEYEVVMKLCKDISGKKYPVYLFTSVQLLKDLLACKTYCIWTIWVNRKYLPEGIHKPSRMICGAYKSYQDGSSNLVATVWQDNRTVRLVTTNSNPRNDVHTDRTLGHNVIQINQPNHSIVQQIHEWCRSSCSNAHEI